MNLLSVCVLDFQFVLPTIRLYETNIYEMVLYQMWLVLFCGGILSFRSEK